MAGEPQYEGEGEVQQIVEGRINTLKEGDAYDIDRATELAGDLGDLARAAREAARILGETSLKPEERAKAEKVMKREIGEALTALRDTLLTHGDKAAKLVSTARSKLEELGAVAKKGPGAYPKPALFGLLGASQFDQWMQELDKNPRAVLEAVATFGKKAADEVQTTAATEAAKKKGVEVASRGNVLADYASSTATERRLAQYELGHND